MFRTKLHFMLCSFVDRVLYGNCYFLYKPLYFAYKHIADSKKIKELRRLVKSKMVILDIGANIGFYSVLFAKLVGEQGKVIAFEPEDNNFAHLVGNVRRFSHVEVHNMAVGEASGKLRFYRSKCCNVDGRMYDPEGDRASTLIECVSIDDCFNTGQSVDVVKIDIQGYEYYALKGMRRTIQTSDNIVILGELWPYAMKLAGVEPQVFLDLMNEYGLELQFDAGRTWDEIITRAGEPYFYTDFFARKKPR